jgi:arylsulfatase A-like enzyme
VTGRLVPHHGIGGAIGAESESLSCAETTVGHVLRGAGYHVAHVGKWHLDAMDEGALIGPLAHGFDRFLGATANFDAAWATDGLGQNYRNWERVVDGLPTRIATYATTRNVDDALALANALPEPWWITVAFNAPHAPYHQPPTELLSGGPPGVDDVSAYRAAVEATDTEFGRLLDGLSGDVRARTQIWWTGDNGSPDDILGVPAKATPYETGTHVPLVVAGWGVAEPGRRSDHLIQVADILPTVAAQSGGSFSDAWWASLDGVSHAGVLSDPAALPAREFAYNGTSNVGDGVIVQESSFTRDDRWKLVRFFSIAYGADWWELYDMDGAGEADDLLLSPLSDEAVDAFDRLLAAHAAIWEPRPPAAP